MATTMGFDFGLESPNLCLKRKFRWLFKVQDVSAQGTNALPPEKGARPSLSFKEIEVQHLNEIIYYPSKPDWKPVTLTLYDLQKNENPVFKWLKEKYDPKEGTWKVGQQFKKPVATLEMYDGCGNIQESWTFENVWPNNIEWGELDMADSSYVVVELTLRYDRAYINENPNPAALG
jgi:hypothetical protein